MEMNMNKLDPRHRVPDPLDDVPGAPWMEEDEPTGLGYLEEADFYEEHNSDE